MAVCLREDAITLSNTCFSLTLAFAPLNFFFVLSPTSTAGR
jgi:hypothetical protein